MIQINVSGINKFLAKAMKLSEASDLILGKIAKDLQFYFHASPIVPTDTGQLRASHRAVRIGRNRWAIVNPRRAGKYFLASLIIFGHRTMVSERQRRYWFWLLRHKYGGSYKRKTKGGPDHVPPRPYHIQIATSYLATGRPTVIAQQVIRSLVG
jgi:hypothetical protein